MLPIPESTFSFFWSFLPLSFTFIFTCLAMRKSNRAHAPGMIVTTTQNENHSAEICSAERLQLETSALFLLPEALTDLPKVSSLSIFISAFQTFQTSDFIYIYSCISDQFFE